jgi:hypothetical protein
MSNKSETLIPDSIRELHFPTDAPAPKIVGSVCFIVGLSSVSANPIKVENT